MPLLPFGGMLYSRDSSNQSNLSLVTRSRAFFSAHTMTPSLTDQPAVAPSFLKLCQPSRDLPSKSSFQPAFLSASVSWLGGCVAAWPAVAVAVSLSLATRRAVKMTANVRVAVQRLDD